MTESNKFNVMGVNIKAADELRQPCKVLTPDGNTYLDINFECGVS